MPHLVTFCLYFPAITFLPATKRLEHLACQSLEGATGLISTPENLAKAKNSEQVFFLNSCKYLKVIAHRDVAHPHLPKRSSRLDVLGDNKRNGRQTMLLPTFSSQLLGKSHPSGADDRTSGRAGERQEAFFQMVTWQFLPIPGRYLPPKRKCA